MPGAVIGPRTLYDKVFQDHIVDEREGGSILLYIGTTKVALQRSTGADKENRQTSCPRSYLTGESNGAKEDETRD